MHKTQMCTRMEDRSWPSPQFCTEVLFGLKAENWLQMAITMSSWNIINSVLITENTAMERLRFASSTPLRLHAVAYVARSKCTIETKFWMSHMNQNSKQPYTNGKKKSYLQTQLIKTVILTEFTYRMISIFSVSLFSLTNGYICCICCII